jgi:hypothetical protein
MQTTNSEVQKKFESLNWHDSRILSISIGLRGTHYVVQLEILFSDASSETMYESAGKIVTFDNCRIIVTDLDLLGLQLCGGMIGGVSVSSDVRTVEKQLRNKIEEFGLPESRLPFDDMFVFEFGLIHPAGEINVFARGFEIVSDPKPSPELE